MSDKTLSQRLREIAANIPTRMSMKDPGWSPSEVAEMIRAVAAQAEAQEAQAGERVVMDGAWVTAGCREVWAAAGYNDKERAAERFRQGPYQAWACGWMESRLALVGSGIYAKPSQAIGEQTPVAKGEMWHADPWLIGNVEAWAKEPPTQAKEDDDDHMKQARAELARVMAANGWDIYGGSTYPWVVAMNYAWQEGWLDAFTRSPMSSEALDLAIDALVAALSAIRLSYGATRDKINKALSALRG